MKTFTFLVSLVLFVGGMLLFGVAFAIDPAFHAIVFASGIAAVVLSLAIPFHLLERLD